VAKLSLDKATFTRASQAYNPHTGERVGPNVLRRNPQRLRVCKFKPSRPYRDFAPGITRMTYAQLLTRMTAFETGRTMAGKATSQIQCVSAADIVDGEYFTFRSRGQTIVFEFDRLKNPTGHVICKAANDIVDGSYFTLDSVAIPGPHKIEFNKSGGPSQSPPTVTVNISAGQSASQVATAVRNAIQSALPWMQPTIDGGDPARVNFTNGIAGANGNTPITQSPVGTLAGFGGMSGGTGTPGVTAGRSGVQIFDGYTAAQVATNVASMLNHLSSAALDVVAEIDPGDSTRVLVKAKRWGAGGNGVCSEDVANAGFIVANMAGGANGELAKEVIGQSTNGRDIVAYWIGTEIGSHTREKLMVLSGVHGNEVDGTEGIFAFFEDLLEDENPEFRPILEQFEFIWIPVCNPDGWFSNLRNLAGVGPNGLTVNLNRQFPYFWDEYNESSAESKGAAPAGEIGAEPEAEAIYDLIVDEAAQTPALVGLVDHHQNIGQGHRYASQNRVYSFQDGRAFNKDWDVYRLQGSIRKQRGTQEDGLFCQFRRSKNVPHLHSWASGSIGLVSMALESRKDEPRAGVEGVKPNCEWTYDTTLAYCVAMTDAFWGFEDTVQIERGATNLLTQTKWLDWLTDNQQPSGYSRSRFTGDRSAQELFPHTAGRSIKVTPKLDATPTGPTPSWAACSLGDVVLAAGRLAAVPGDIQTMRLSSETVATAPGPSGTPPPGATRGFGMVFAFADFQAFALGGWAEDGNSLKLGGFGVDAANPGVASAPGSTALPEARADMGYANDGTRYSVFVGGSVGTVTGPFVASVDGKILRFDAVSQTWTDTTLTVPACKFACVVHQPGTDKFWIFGGEDAAGVPVNTIHVYDRAAGTVTLHGTALPAKMSRIAGAAYDGDTIYLYGGRYEVSPGVYQNDPEVRKFTPSSGALAVVSVLANLEDEASHDETPWSMRWSGAIAARRIVSGTVAEIFLLGGKKGAVGSEVDQTEIYVHRPESNVLTFARNGTYAILQRSEDIIVAEGDWVSISTWSRALEEGALCYHRAALTMKASAGGTWLRHGRSYYRVPFFGRWMWERTATPVKAGETRCRPMLRTYIHDQSILYDRWMVAKRSRASSYIDGTRADELLVFSERIPMNGFKLKFTWNPTFGFVNVGEDLELARVQIDANNYIALVLIKGNPEKTYHNGNALKGPVQPQVELRKVQGGVTVATLSRTLYYGYDCRSSNQENYEDPVEFEIEHAAGQRFAFGINRYGTLARVEDRATADAWASGIGFLRFNGEGEYGVPSLDVARSTSRARVSESRVDLAAAPTALGDCIHPGEPIAA
jgi:hypothetical protein